MVVMIVLAAVYAVAQLALLGWVARSVRWRTLVVAVPVGMLAVAPAAVALEWTWTRAWSAATGSPVASVVQVAGYTVDPVIEELVKLGPVLVVWWLVARVRRQWGYTDVLLVCAAVGSGVGLAEDLLRFADRAGGAFGGPLAGWTIPASVTGVFHVPGLGELLGSWVPAGVQVESFLASSPTDAINVHLVWSSVAGLGLALLLRPPRRGVRWVGAALVAFTAADHAADNTVSGGGAVAHVLAMPLNATRHLIWAYPLIALGCAALLDRRALTAGRIADPTVLLAAERAGATDAPWALARGAMAHPPRSVVAATGFVRLRRAYWTGLVRVEVSAAKEAPADLEAGRPPDPVGAALRSLVPVMGAAAGPARGSIWAQVEARLAGLHGARPAARGDRSDLVRIVAIAAWVVLLAGPFTYLVIGGVPELSAVQNWMASPFVFRVLVLMSIAAAGWTGWRLVSGLRALRRIRSAHPVGELPATLVLATGTRVGSLAVTATAWLLVIAGSTATGHVVSNFHVLDAVGQALIILALMLALTAIALDPPLALATLVGGGRILVPVAISAATAETLVVSAGLGTIGIILMNIEPASSGGAGEPAPRLRYEASPKHGPTQRGNVGKEPEDGQAALDRSVQVKDTSSRRVGVDPTHDEIVVFDATREEQGLFHGHVRTWAQLRPEQRAALLRAGLVDKGGRILP